MYHQLLMKFKKLLGDVTKGIQDTYDTYDKKTRGENVSVNEVDDSGHDVKSWFQKKINQLEMNLEEMKKEEENEPLTAEDFGLTNYGDFLCGIAYERLMKVLSIEIEDEFPGIKIGDENWQELLWMLQSGIKDMKERGNW